ncbi:protein FAM200C-like [Palaemon carinicauda]|uniref:protein FAM200C-like n=1 Tax=Palaemon carinicauda TaxID=392227 RepID=UPI0035B590BA
MAKIVLGKEAEKKLQQVSLSNDVIHNRIIDMNGDILKQVVADLKASPVKISIQVDESTDVSNCCQLLAVVRYVNQKRVEGSFLFCQSLKTTAQSKDVFDNIQEFFSRNELHLDRIGSICTDGAPVMLGNRSGFAALMRKEIPKLKIIHCFLHCHALAAKTLSPDLEKTLNVCVEAMNLIRSQALNHRLFQSLCEEIGQEQTVLLYHTEVRWLSRGRVLSRVFELRGEIHHFLHEQVQELAIHFNDPSLVQMLAYLADVFSALNELNLSLQGRGLNIFPASEKFAAFKEKLVLWMLFTFFDGYFSCGEIQACNNWILNLFMQNLEDVDDDGSIREDLIDMIHNLGIQMEFTNSQLVHFWASQLEAYPALATKALEVLVPFATTYLCEQGFFYQLHIKTKNRNRLNSEHDMRVVISTKTKRFDAIMEKKNNNNEVTWFTVQYRQNIMRTIRGAGVCSVMSAVRTSVDIKFAGGTHHAQPPVVIPAIGTPQPQVVTSTAQNPVDSEVSASLQDIQLDDRISEVSDSTEMYLLGEGQEEELFPAPKVEEQEIDEVCLKRALPLKIFSEAI